MQLFQGVMIKNEREIGFLRDANQIVAHVLDEIANQVKPGVSTMLFEEIAQTECRAFNVKPGFMGQGYPPYPFALCCSVNEQIVHGFPSTERILKEGDIVSFDMGVIYNGFYGDSARTCPVGTISEEDERLLKVTRESLFAGIAAAKPGGNLLDISRAVQEHVEKAGFGVVRCFVGHGVGRKLHEKPEIPNFVTPHMKGLILKPGMALAIEPMVTVGSYEVDILEDKWTAVTRDRKNAAHFEHSVAITKTGVDILSLAKGEKSPF